MDQINTDYISNKNIADTTSSISSNFASQQEKQNDIIDTDIYRGIETEEVDIDEFIVPDGYEEYTVKEGETLESIATSNNTTIDDLKRVNTELNEEIKEGDIIFIPMKQKKMGGEVSSSHDSSSKVEKSNKPVSTMGNSGGGNSDNSSSIREEDPNPIIRENNQNNKYSDATSDLRELDLDELREIYENYILELANLLDKYNYTIEEFDRIYSLAKSWATENNILPREDLDMYMAVAFYLEEHSENKQINVLDLEEIIATKETIDDLKKEYFSDYEFNYKDYYHGSIEDSNPYKIAINNIIKELGYKESEIEELTTTDIMNIFHDNEKDINIYLKEALKLPNEYNTNTLLSTYVVNYYLDFIPEENTTLEEALDNYALEAIDILSKMGYKTSNLEKLNNYEIIKLLKENEENINKYFTDNGINISNDNFGFVNLFTNNMDNIAYSIATESYEKFEEYMINSTYSEDTIQKSLEYYKNDNIESALLTVRLEDLENNKKTIDKQLKTINTQIDDIIMSSEYSYLFERTDLTYEEKIEIINNNGDTTFKELLAKKDELKKSKEEIGSSIYQTKIQIEKNSFQYLDDIRESDEYNNIVNNRVISYNIKTNEAIKELFEREEPIDYATIQQTIDNTIQSQINNVYLSLVEAASFDNKDIDYIKEVFNNQLLNYDRSEIDSVEEFNIEDGIYKVKIKLNDGTYVNIDYDKSESSTLYTFEQKGEIILKTNDLNRFSEINLMEVYNYVLSLDKYKDMSKEEIFKKVFNYNDEVMLHYTNEFDLTELCYLNLDNKELDDYTYIFKTMGADEAKRYLETKRDDIHQELGMEAALKDLNYIMNGNYVFREGFVGLENGVDGWIDNTYTFFTKDTTMTPTEYESQYLLSLIASLAKPISIEDSNSLSDTEKETLNELDSPTYLDEYYVKGLITEEQYDYFVNSNYYEYFTKFAKNHPNLLNYSYMIGQNVGNMLPSVLSSILVSPLGAVSVGTHIIGAGQITAGAMMYAGAYGGSYKQAIRKGNNENRSMIYASLSATSEVLTEYFLGRIPGVGRISKVTNPVVTHGIKQALAMKGINLLKDIGGEILEESLQIWIDYALNQSILGEEIDLSGWGKEELDTIIVTTFTTLILGIPGNIASIPNELSKQIVIKINENTDIKLSFKEIYDLNQKYVDPETGRINMEGLTKELNERLSDYKLQLGYDLSDLNIFDKKQDITLTEYKTKVYTGDFARTLDGITFVSNTQAGLDSLINLYNKAKNDKNINGEYFTNLLNNKGLIITDIETRKNAVSCQWGNIIYFAQKDLEKEDLITFFHECGHFIDRESSYKYQDTFNEAIKKIKNHKDFNIFKAILQYYKDNINYLKDENSKIDKQEIEKRVREEVPKKYKHWDKLSSKYKEKVIRMEISKEVSKIKSQLYEKSGISTISDILDAITRGFSSNLTMIGHGSVYYKRENAPYLEILANISALFNNEIAYKLYEYFPKEIVDELLASFEELLNIDKIKSEPSYNMVNYRGEEIESEYSDDMLILQTLISSSTYMNEDLKLDFHRKVTAELTSNRLLNEFRSYYDNAFGEGTFFSILQEYIKNGVLPEDKIDTMYEGVNSNLNGLLSLLPKEKLKVYMEVEK